MAHHAWVAVFVLAELLTLSFSPPVHYNLGDEVWAVRSSLGAIDRGLPADLVSPKLYFLIMGAYLKAVAGGVFAGRAFTVFTAAGVLYATYLIGRILGGTARCGFLASLMLGASFPFFWHAKVVRHEMMSALVAALAVYGALRARGDERAGRWAFVSGLSAALSVNVHPNNLQYAIALPPFFLILAGRRALGRRGAWFVCGAVLGALMWYALIPHGTGAPGAVVGVGIQVASFPMPILVENPTRLILDSLQAIPLDAVEYVRLFDGYYPNAIPLAVPAACAAALVAVALVTGRRGGALLLLGFIALTDFVSHLVAPKFGYWHMVELYPFVAVAAALGIEGVLCKAEGRTGRRVSMRSLILIPAAAIVVLGVFDTAWTSYRFFGYDYGKVLGAVSRKVDGRVLAMDLYAPAFPEGQAVGPWFGIDAPGRGCGGVEEKIRALGVRYIVADELLQAFARMSCGPAFEGELMRYFFTRTIQVDAPPVRYPSHWVGDKTISEVYVLRVKE